LPNIEQVSVLTLSGGEPFHDLRTLELILKFFKKWEVEVNNFYIATNGTYLTKDALKFITELYCFCTDNECSQITISQDKYHQEAIDRTQLDQHMIQHNIKQLMAFRFTELSTISNYAMVDEGNARNLQNVRKMPISAKPELDLELYDDDLIVQNTIYINSFGDVFTNCDLSYATQRIKEHRLCTTENLIETIMKGGEAK
jgi:organic radical activating enzyme